MPVIKKTIEINADPVSAMEYIANVENHPAFISPLKSVSKTTGDPKQPGTSWEWTFVMAGVELTGTAEALEYKEGELYKYKTTGQIDSTFTYAIEDKGDGNCELTITVEYQMPETLMAKAINKPLAQKINQEAGEQAAENIKIVLETVA